MQLCRKGSLSSLNHFKKRYNKNLLTGHTAHLFKNIDVSTGIRKSNKVLVPQFLSAGIITPFRALSQQQCTHQHQSFSVPEETNSHHIQISIKTRREPRAATVFVDGDDLSPEAVNTLSTALNVLKEKCRFYIARQASTPPLSVLDDVAPDHLFLPTSMLIDRKTTEWVRFSRNMNFTDSNQNTGKPIARAKKTSEIANKEDVFDAAVSPTQNYQAVQLQDIIYMCGASKWNFYYEYIVRQYEKSDCDVYLASPQQVQLVTAKCLDLAFEA